MIVISAMALMALGSAVLWGFGGGILVVGTSLFVLCIVEKVRG